MGILKLATNMSSSAEAIGVLANVGLHLIISADTNSALTASLSWQSIPRVG
jgi:hypothetical protein